MLPDPTDQKPEKTEQSKEVKDRKKPKGKSKKAIQEVVDESENKVVELVLKGVNILMGHLRR